MMTRFAHARSTWLVILPVWLFFFLALNSLVGDSPTMDEQNHIARGLAFLDTADPRFSLEHPPLVNLLSALPLLTLPDVRLPTDHPSWERPEGWYEFADLLLWQYNRDATRMVFLARMPILFLTIGLALVGYLWARQLWGRPSTLIAFVLILLDPNILAHGRYATTDIGGTTFLFLAVFLLWRMWQTDGWHWRRWWLAGLGLGLAFGSKLSAFVFVPILVVMAWLPVYGRATHWRDGLRRFLQLGTAGLLSMLVVWAIFGFQWQPFQFRSESLAFLNEWSGPMPTFWAGIEQIAGFTGGGRGNAFLLGKFSDQGFLAYFPVAFLSKTPLPILLLLPLAAIFLLKRKQTRPQAIFLLLPAILFFLLSMQSALNIGYRHLLPMLPFLLVLISGLASGRVGEWASGRVASGRVGEWASGRVANDTLHAPRFTPRVLRFTVYAAVISLLISDFLIHPHYLSYFNAAAGGPENGYNILVDSNIDWGQDLLRLKGWMAENGVAQVNLAWFGTADPGYYGMSYRPLPGLGRGEFFPLWWDVPFDRMNPEPGVYAISVSNLWELPLREEEKTVFAWFRAREPDDRVGYSILIYEIP